MAFHNPFIKDGLIKFPDNGSLVKHVERWARVRGDKRAYRFIDFSIGLSGASYWHSMQATHFLRQ